MACSCSVTAANVSFWSSSAEAVSSAIPGGDVAVMADGSRYSNCLGDILPNRIASPASVVSSAVASLRYRSYCGCSRGCEQGKVVVNALLLCYTMPPTLTACSIYFALFSLGVC